MSSLGIAPGAVTVSLSITWWSFRPRKKIFSPPPPQNSPNSPQTPSRCPSRPESPPPLLGFFNKKPIPAPPPGLPPPRTEKNKKYPKPHELLDYVMVNKHDWDAKTAGADPVPLSSQWRTKAGSLYCSCQGRSRRSFSRHWLEALQWSFVCLLTGVFPEVRYLKGPHCLKGKSVL